MSYRLISVVLPVHNQADHLSNIVVGFAIALKEIGTAWELLLVPNACRDQSIAVCHELQSRYACVRVICTDRAGWGLAVKTGLAHARGDLLAFTNSARTSPAELALALSTACATPNVIVTARRDVRDRWFRHLGSRLYNLECRLLFDVRTTDINGTPKVFPRVFDALFRLACDDDLLDAEFHIAASRAGYPRIEIPIRATRRHGGRSTMTLRRAMRLYAGAYKLARRMRKGRG